MRLWSIHPKYLDCAGLVALWREALLAQKVLAGKTRGYKNHPQLERFKKCKDPAAAIGAYLLEIYKESCARCYCFDKGKISVQSAKISKIPVSRGQIVFEFNHLKMKLKRRCPDKLKALTEVGRVEAHPIFKIVDGPEEEWEKSPVKQHL